ncbi:MAG: hypothetical protein ACYC6T_02120 [Thermoleophilia bacterium]
MAAGASLLRDNLLELDSGIRACLDVHANTSALVLVYSAIDVCAWLASDTEETTRSTFTGWVDRYLLPARKLDCTSDELYGARCGLLHTFTPESRQSREGKVRTIGYAWGNASLDALAASRNAIGKEHLYSAVHFNELHEAWRLGVNAFISDLERDPKLKATALAKASTFFAKPDPAVIEAFGEPPV